MSAASFWARVTMGDGCWEIGGYKDKGGYGQVKVQKPRRRCVRAHRYAWELTHGPIPEGLFVCHHCDNPACVRPDHLFLGTAADNRRDCDTKGRHGRHGRPPVTRGEAHPGAKLKDAEAQAIRERRLRGEPLKDIAKDYGISISLVSLIALGQRRMAVVERVDPSALN